MVSPIPNTPKVVKLSDAIPGIKSATPEQYYQEEPNVNDSGFDVRTQIFFDSMESIDIINIARNDAVNGQKIIYQPIKNLEHIEDRYGSKNILPMFDTENVRFKSFSIKLEDRISSDSNPVYLSAAGDLTVEAIDLADDELIEIEILKSGEAINDTIYGG
jgi:hypothetical protein